MTIAEYILGGILVSFISLFTPWIFSLAKKVGKHEDKTNFLEGEVSKLFKSTHKIQEDIGGIKETTARLDERTLEMNNKLSQIVSIKPRSP